MRRTRSVGVKSFIHAVGLSGVASPQRRMARAMFHESSKSATLSAWSRSSLRHGMRPTRRARPSPTSARRTVLRLFRSRTRWRWRDRANRAQRGARRSGNAPAGAPSARTTGWTVGASASTRANHGSPGAGGETTCTSVSPCNARSAAVSAGADAPFHRYRWIHERHVDAGRTRDNDRSDGAFAAYGDPGMG